MPDYIATMFAAEFAAGPVVARGFTRFPAPTMPDPFSWWLLTGEEIDRQTLPQDSNTDMFNETAAAPSNRTLNIIGGGVAVADVEHPFESWVADVHAHHDHFFAYWRKTQKRAEVLPEEGNLGSAACTTRRRLKIDRGVLTEPADHGQLFLCQLFVSVSPRFKQLRRDNYASPVSPQRRKRSAR